MTPDRVGLLLTIGALLVVGLFFVLYLGVGTLRRVRAWEVRAVRTMATVVRHESRTYKNNVHHSPVVRFVTPAGAEVEFEAQRARRQPDPPVGGPLEVLYDPADPKVARLPGQDRAGAMFMIGVGALFVVVGIVLAAVLLARL
jgi:hypothetical protein